ncbi:GMC family oxidoreductase N-terminal domain-containing protein [Nocardioides zeae]|uniref:GMC family oxidoreductase N-terminal domain-containing protein n=1 Tax=Nocardioides imazamoxiresistens TaxID=3231893 RepID=A0ABU3PSI8_9ACTN|nr:GMC family oxidoreductase N-terminal domain-containing protein [Nocardioides zeae]MDT9592153.1 GMC family oxidoreductase N-terminal domain-containing protein [Nocardioides zeae]
MPEQSSTEFDYVIVGSGAGGAVVANRLSADPRHRVLLIEAGGPGRNPMHLVPKGFYFTMNDPRSATTYSTEEYGDGQVATWPRGRVLGGSTTINGMVWNRGWAPDYDAWEARGLEGWNWDRFLQAFKELEDHELGAGPYRGKGGPVSVSIARPTEEVSDALIEAMGTHGIGFVEDPNGSDDERVGYVASSIRRGTRVSTARAFLRPARRRPNLTVVTGTTADRLVLDGTRVVAVEARRKGRPVTYRVAREVIVAGGPLESPQLLERSGIGRPDVLEAAGIPVRVASPKVGENLREHRGIQLQVRLKGAAGYNRQASSFVRQMWAGFKYLFTRRGLIAFGGYNVVANWRSDPAAERPDTHVFFTPISTSRVNPISGRLVVDSFPGARMVVSPTFPTSEGSIHVTSPDPDAAPRIVPNFMATQHDRDLIPKVLEKARAILATEPFSRLVAEELEPGPALPPKADVADFALNKGVAGIHTLGTCSIGPDADDVVDGRLRVRGVEGLRVVDSSVFPAMPSGNCSAPTQALAWIASGLILEDA